jgi:CheY-like chemotaxis protein
MHLGVRSHAAAAPAIPLPRWGYEGRRRTIMVVDDHAEHRDLVREVLEPLGFTVLEAEDAPSCLALVAEIRPDLFLLDISMPGMDGWELAATLRASGFGGTRIVVLSANIGESRPPSVEIDAHDDALAKPFELRRLLDVIQVQLGLDWLHEPPVAARAVETAAQVSTAPRPSRTEIEEMMQLARIGYVRGLEQKLTAIEARLGAGGVALHPRLVEVRRATADFDMGRVVSELEAFDGDA